MRKEIVIVGSGGQGVQSMGRLLATALNNKGYLSTFKPNYGPEARGGNSSAEVIIKESEMDWPEILAIDLLIAMSQEGYEKWTAKINPKVDIIYDNDLVKTAPLPHAHQYPVPATKIANELNAPISANMVMLGTVASMSGLLDIQDVIQVMSKRARSDTNLKAIEEGFERGKTLATATASA